MTKRMVVIAFLAAVTPLSLNANAFSEAAVRCYQGLIACPCNGYVLSYGKSGTYILAAKRDAERGVYIVQRSAIHWVTVPESEYDSWKALSLVVPDEPKLYLHVTFKSESYVTFSTEKDSNLLLEDQLKKGDVVSLEPQKIDLEDVSAKSAIQGDLLSRIKSLPSQIASRLQCEQGRDSIKDVWPLGVKKSLELCNDSTLWKEMTNPVPETLKTLESLKQKSP